MAATSQLLTNFGRIAGAYGNVSVIPVLITASATAYATASGGLPVDLTSVLQQASPWEQDFLNPGDIVGVYSTGPSTNGFVAGPLVLGTPTYTTKALASTQNPNNRVLATCPATLRLYGSGSGARAAFQEIADGSITDTITIHLIVARGGQNP
jgi:hypothetical protein